MRRFFAHLEIDDEVTDAIGDTLEREMKPLEEKGISLVEWMVADWDDEDEWARYIYYLIGWAFNSLDDNIGDSPASLQEWQTEIDVLGENYPEGDA